MIPSPPALDTADASGARAMYPIGAWRIGYRTPSSSETLVMIRGCSTDGTVPVGPGRPGTVAAVACAALPPNATPRPHDHEWTPFQRTVAEAVARLRPGELVTYASVWVDPWLLYSQGHARTR